MDFTTWQLSNAKLSHILRSVLILVLVDFTTWLLTISTTMVVGMGKVLILVLVDFTTWRFGEFFWLGPVQVGS